MIQQASIDELAFLFRADEPHRPIVLLGAGASFASGIPLAGPMVNEIAKWSYARTVRNTTPDRTHFRRSEWEEHLKAQSWFRADVDRAELYPDAVEQVLVPREFRRSFFQRVISEHLRPSGGYEALAQLCTRHLVSHFLTTNFDTLLETALRAQAPQIREVTTVNKSPKDFEAFSPHRKAQIIYLHGSVENYSDKSLRAETLNLDSELLRRTHSLIEYSPVVVVGYRGAERSVMHGLFEKGLTISGKYRRGIYWCMRGDAAPPPNLVALAQKVGNNLRIVRVEGFDEVFCEINRRLAGESLNPQTVTTASGAGLSVRSTDLQPVKGRSLEDLDQTSLRAVLEEHYRRINNDNIRDFEAHLLEYEFASRDNGAVVPHFGLWLLFGRDVTEKFPYLKSIVRIGEKEQKVIDGNLLTQFTTLKQFLDSPEVNPTLRIKKAGIAEEKRAFHPRALLELLVNHFAHRDYSIEEPSEIYIEPGHGISFKTVGGLPQGVFDQLAPNEEGAFHPRRGVREQRNPLIADIFYGMRIMDREGSGLVDVQQFALDHEGDAEFRVAHKNAKVVASLFQAKADPTGHGKTARGLKDRETFIANLFRIHKLPESIYSVPLFEPYGSKPSELHNSGVDFAAIPPMRTHGGMLTTFETLKDYADKVESIVDIKREEPEPLSAWLSNAGRRNIIVAIIGKYWQRLLERFSADGLTVNGKRERQSRQRPQNDDCKTLLHESTSS